MDVMAVLQDSGFDMSLEHIAECSSCGLDWLRRTSSWIPYDFKMGEMSDIRSRRASLARRRNVDEEPLVIVFYQLPPCFLYQGPYSVTNYSGSGASAAARESPF